MPAEASVVERLRGMPPDVREQAVAALARRGLLDAVDVAPTRQEPRSDALTVKQRTLWSLDADGRHGDFYRCAALWSAPAVAPGALAAAFVDVADGFDALGRGIADGPACPRAVPVPRPVPVTDAVPDVADPGGWVRAAVGAAAAGPVDPATRSAEVTVFAHRDGSSALAVVGHDLHLDRQGLVQILGPAVAARLAGVAPAVEELGIGDVAAWQEQRIADGVLEPVAAARREMLRDTPPCPWPTGGDRTGRRLEVAAGPRVAEHQRALAAAAGVSVVATVLAAWYRALAVWRPATARLPIGCCTTARLRPEFASTLGNLTNTVVVAPGRGWPRMRGVELRTAAHQGMTEALCAVDVPFELAFPAAAPVPDEAVGVRFTFVEDTPAEPGTPLLLDTVPVGYAKAALSCEVRDRPGDLGVWIDHRPAAIPDPDADRLVVLLRQELGRN